MGKILRISHNVVEQNYISFPKELVVITQERNRETLIPEMMNKYFFTPLDNRHNLLGDIHKEECKAMLKKIGFYKGIVVIQVLEDEQKQLMAVSDKSSKYMVRMI